MKSLQITQISLLKIENRLANVFLIIIGFGTASWVCPPNMMSIPDTLLANAIIIILKLNRFYCYIAAIYLICLTI